MKNTTLITRFFSLDKSRGIKATALFGTVLGLTATCTSGFIQDLNRPIWFAICLGFSLIGAVASLIYTTPKLEINQKFQIAKAEIIIKVGDILKESCNIAIASNDYFETLHECEPKQTLRGSLIDTFFPTQNVNEPRAEYIEVQNAYISKQGNGLVGETYSKTDEKGNDNAKDGNQIRYDVGTILEIPHNDRTIFMVVMATLDTEKKNANAPLYDSYTDAKDALQAITALFERFFSRGEIVVAMPPLGTGYSGAQNSDIFLRVTTLITAYAMFISDNRHKSSKLTIIIPKTKYDGKQMLALERVLRMIVV